MPSKARELWEEFRTVVFGQNSFMVCDTCDGIPGHWANTWKNWIS